MGLVRIIARHCRDRLGEGPLWSEREASLYWVDILGQKLHRLRLADDVITGWNLPEPIGWVIERAGGPGLIAGLRSGIVELGLDPLAIKRRWRPEADRPANRFNDAKADARGRIWAGSMRMDGTGAAGAFYRLDPGGTCTRVDDGYQIANGPAFSPNGCWLYHADSGRGIVYRYALGDDGSLAARHPFIQFEAGWGLPDGMTVDADGHLWVAHWGAGCISRFTPEGARERSIVLPASQITSCTFAGPGLDRMFVTSAADGRDEPDGGALFEVDPGCRGLPTNIFAG